ncbi:MAG: O-Antigen ligase [Planctomycetes bacterium ADurb.Bin126]|nr:MAG: O-Antigen ligase [Planctomycetes bacterium ADurb.Bin126]HOD80792.1 O-antigen ligase family protein [Phycisphaerae bacterium]HQL72053.1 O-antigen ligase family protein [Phycisphaerae bacterium]
MTAGRHLQRLALALLVLVLVARCFLGEMSFRTSQLRGLPAADEAGQALSVRADRTELSRVVFSLLLLGAWCAYLGGAALRRELRLRLPLAGGLAAGFAVLSLLSALRAGDQRTALVCWLEQSSLLGAGYLAIQVFERPRAFAVLVVVLAAVGTTLAVKGLVQVFIEAPARAADFDENRAQRLAEVNIQPGSEQERLFEGRLKNPAPFGYFSLANPYASLLLVASLAAGGLAADKWRRARADRPRAKLKKGEIHLPALAAGVQSAVVAVQAGVVVLAQSLGATASLAAASAGAGGIWAWRERLARHWRKALLVAAGGLVLGLAAAAAHGLYHDSLPSRTMTVRWQYWTGAARALAERPWLGVGPGNFSTAYLPHRPMAGEESVKDPHNVIMHALVQHGVPGGLCYLGVLGLFLAAMCRPRRRGWDEATSPPDSRNPQSAIRQPACRQAGPRFPWALLAGAVLAVGVVRLSLADTSGGTEVLLFDAIAPALVLALALVIGLWEGPTLRRGLDVPREASRVALACGAAGFALHSLVEISPYMPGSATAFWIAAGAAVAAAGAGRVVDCTPVRWVLAGLLLALTGALTAWLLPPVAARTAAAQDMLDAMVRRQPLRAVAAAERAAQADPLDPLAAVDAARLHMSLCPRQAGRMQDCLSPARRWAEEAVLRDPTDFAHYALLGDIAWYQAFPDCFTFAPMHARSLPPASAATAPAATMPAPRSPQEASDRAELAGQAGQYARAAALLEQAVEAKPASPCLLERLGDAQWLAGRADQARASWRRATEIYHANADAASAARWTARAVKLNPMDLRLRVDCARRLAALGRYEKCLAQLDVAERIDASYYPQSVSRFSEAERRTIRLLRERCK